MLIAKNNIKISHDTFIDNMYNLYITLINNKGFTEQGIETGGFKTWKRKDEYFILDKSTGRLITWHKLLGWNLCSNDTIRDGDWKRFCELLRNDLIANGYEIYVQEELYDYESSL